MPIHYGELGLSSREAFAEERARVITLFWEGTRIPELALEEQANARRDVSVAEQLLNQRFGQSIAPARADKANEILFVSSMTFATMHARKQGLPTLPDDPSYFLLKDVMEGLGFSQGDGRRTVVHTTLYEAEPRQMRREEAVEVGIHEVVHSKAEPAILEQKGGTIIKRKGGKWTQEYGGSTQDTQQVVIDEAMTDILSIWAKNPMIASWDELEKISNRSWITTVGHERSRLGVRMLSLLSQAAYGDFDTGLDTLGHAYFRSDDFIDGALTKLGDSGGANVRKQMVDVIYTDTKKSVTQAIVALEQLSL